jgi:tetratricopeptide (TPR) repeat protein
VLQEVPDNQMLLLALGDLHNDTKEYQTAEQYLTQAYEIDPSFFSDPWENGLLLTVFLKQEKYDETARWGQRIIADHPDNSEIRAEVEKILNKLPN